jgi:hypothetical protein
MEHGAADSALGYLYQSELALLELVQRSKAEPALVLSIELLDDVAFEASGAPTELLQAKHRLRTKGSLSDASSDLWKTLGVWMDAMSSSGLELPTVRLVTTGTAPAGSASSFLRSDTERDPERALDLLERTARTSGSTANKPTYKQFLDRGSADRLAFLESITILDNALTIVDIPNALIRELRFASEARFRQPLVERLLGWWHRRVIRHLLATDDRIYAEEVDNEVDALRDQFKADNLPIDISLEEVPLGDLAYEDRVFVRQLQLVAASQPTIEIAIRDYKRAFLQRSRWIADQLVSDSELHRYEQRLIEEWEHHAAYLADIAKQSDAALCTAGLELYRLLQDEDLWIRPRCQERFVARGSYHKLADDLDVGWHPQFLTRLRTLLEPAAR